MGIPGAFSRPAHKLLFIGLRYFVATRYRFITGREERRNEMSTILVVLLVLLLVGALPTWPYSANWGYGPTGGVGLIVLILVILLLTGRL